MEREDPPNQSSKFSFKAGPGQGSIVRFSTHLLRPQFFDIFGGFMMGSFPHDFWVRIQIFGSEPESKTSLGVSTGGKGSKSLRSAAEAEEVEEDGTGATGVTREVFRRLPMGVHRYDPMNPPIPSLRAGTAFVDTIIEQLPMLTEKGLRELNMALSYEMGFRGDVVREHQEEMAAEARAS